MFGARGLLVVFLIIIVGADSEVAQFVQVLVVGDNADPIAKTVLLQVFLGQILQVALGEVHVGVDEDLHLLTLHRDIAAQVSGLAVDLEAFLQEFLLQKHVIDSKVQQDKGRELTKSATSKMLSSAIEVQSTPNLRCSFFFFKPLPRSVCFLGAGFLASLGAVLDLAEAGSIFLVATILMDLEVMR